MKFEEGLLKWIRLGQSQGIGYSTRRQVELSVENENSTQDKRLICTFKKKLEDRLLYKVDYIRVGLGLECF